MGDDDTLGFELYGNLDQGDPAEIVLRIGRQTLTVVVNPDTGEATMGRV